MALDLTKVVERALRDCEDARNSDNKLIYYVMRYYGMKKEATFAQVINAIINGDLPAFASITRAKRKVVELHPELDCKAEVRRMRSEQEEMYKEYARMGK